MFGRKVLEIFLLPGNPESDALGAQKDGDRVMIRLLITMLFWNLIIVLAVVLWWM